MMHKMTEEMITSYREHLIREEYAGDTITKYTRDIRAFLVWIREWDGAAKPASDDEAVRLASAAGTGVDEKAVPDDEAVRSVSAAGTRITEKPASDDEAVRSVPSTGTGGVEKASSDEEAQSVSFGDTGDGGEAAVLQDVGIDKEATAGWKAHLVSKGHAPSTVNAMLSSLNSLLDFLGWKECKVKFLKIQRRTFRDQEKELSRAEYERLLRTARGAGNDRLALLLETVCATGIRVSEVQYVTMEALHRRRADISLKGKVRTILLPGKLCKKLIDYARKRGIRSGEIFVTKNGRGMSRRQIWQEMKNLCGKAAVNPTKVFPHNLRHLFARIFYKACRDIVKLADVLGHSSIETTRIYLISTGETHARQMEKLGLIS